MDPKYLSTDELTNSTRDTLLLRCKATLATLSSDIDTERKARQSAERQIIAMSRELDALQDELDTRKRREQNSMAEEEEEMKEKSHLKMRIAGMEERLRSVLEEKEELRGRGETLIEELESTQKALEEAKQLCNDKDEEMAQWSDLMESAQEKLERMAADNNTLRSEKVKLMDNCERLMAQNDKLDQLLQASRSETQLLSVKLDQLREQHLEKLTALERDKALQHQSLSENFNQQTLKYHEEMQREIKEYRLSTQAAEAEMKRLAAENDQLSLENSQLKGKLHTYEASLSESSQHHQSSQAQIHTLKGELDHMHRDYQQELDFKAKMHSQAVARVDEELRAHEQTRRQVEELAGKLARGEAAAQAEIADLKRKVENLTADLNRKSGEYTDLSAEYERFKQENEANFAHFQQETVKSHSAEIRHFEGKLRLLESQLDQDRDSYQQEMQRIKEQYSSALLSSSDELAALRGERNLSRTTISELETRLAALTSRMKAKSETIAEKLSPREEKVGWKRREESEGIRFIEQLRDLTTKLEKSLPKPPSQS
jgi:chromosome segregation ATPase